MSLYGIPVVESRHLPHGKAIIVSPNGHVERVVVGIGNPPLYTRMCLGVIEAERDRRRRRRRAEGRW